MTKHEFWRALALTWATGFLVLAVLIYPWSEMEWYRTVVVVVLLLFTSVVTYGIALIEGLGRKDREHGREG